MRVRRPPSKRRRLWLIPGGLLVGGLIVLFAWWQYFKTTPSYTLALLVAAAQQNDQAALDRVVDVDSVIDNFIKEGAENSSLGVATSLVTPLRTQLASLAPEAAAGVRASVRQEIRNRINELAGSTRSGPFLVTALAMPFKAEINQTGGLAQVKINSGQVELHMLNREGIEWRVISLRDQELAARVINGIIKDMPRLGSPVDQLRELPETLQKLPLLNGK